MNKALPCALLTITLAISSHALAGYQVRNFVSDQPGQALITDTNLVNPWGIAINPAGGAIWVSDNHSDSVTLYSGDVNGSPFTKTNAPFQTVSVPGGAPTGQVFNAVATDFLITNGTNTASAAFITASESGQLTGWNPAVAPNTTFKPAATIEGANFKGLAIASNAGSQFLYASDFSSGTIRTFNNTFAPVSPAGTFTDPNLPPGYVPFNVQNLAGKLYVTYALKSAPTDTDETTGPGLGIVDTYDTAGNFLQRLVSPGSVLNAPWGLALAPASFGDFPNALLVGNFGDGHINAFNPTTGALLGTLTTDTGPITLDGLWALNFGNGTTAGSSNTLYFTAGPNDETHGLFGSIAVPEPTSLPLLGLLALPFSRRIRRTHNQCSL